jgi:hypothetical protein
MSCNKRKRAIKIQKRRSRIAKDDRKYLPENLAAENRSFLMVSPEMYEVMKKKYEEVKG